jgi:acetyl esterase/lipase
MHARTTISAASFDPAAVAPETLAANEALIAGLAGVGWTFPPASVEALRTMPAAEPYFAQRAETISVPAADGDIALRVVRSPTPTGVYLFYHPGGWTIGAADGHDADLERIVAATGMTAVSVDYRLAPEHPYPAGLDDCEQAARWVLANAQERFGASRVVIAGASAGANLALCTLLRLRETAGWEQVAGASLLYGNYDLTMTPSQRTAAPDRFLISTASLEWFYDQYVPDRTLRDDPDVSPLYADLGRLCPTLVTVGTHDSLVDDSVFLACRMLAQGSPCELQLVPGGEHAFDLLPIASSREALARVDAFLAGLVGAPAAQPVS